MPKKSNYESQENVKAYTSLVCRRLQDAMRWKGWTQKQLSEKTQIPPSTLSKIFSKDSTITLTLPMIYVICNALEIDPSLITSPLDNILDHATQYNDRMRVDLPHEPFKFNPFHPVFKGIVNETFYFYCLSTIADERKILKGLLQLTPEGDFCAANLRLDTGAPNNDNESPEEDASNYVKEYKGYAFSSDDTMVVSVLNETISDYLFLSWNRFTLHSKKLLCRLAIGITVSSGSKKRASAIKAIISRTPLDDQSLQDLRGQLYINNSNIMITEEDYNEIQSRFTEREKDVLDCLIKMQGGPKTVYTISEDQLFNSVLKTNRASLPKDGQYYLEQDENNRKKDKKRKIELINLLRNFSLNKSMRYVKLSTNSDDLLFNYISDLEKKNN